ncbi:MAG: hypothetical protein GPOALKHO_001513 [Sodalis sp.]|nr:MAG: hypothetical protein GPOALKHO_001513 [Sodalis sp.]
MMIWRKWPEHETPLMEWLSVELLPRRLTVHIKATTAVC